MIVAGCDVGSLTAKAVIMNGGGMLGYSVIKAKSKPEESAAEVMSQALGKTGFKMEDVSCCVGTGYGRSHISFVNLAMSEIACHGKGAQWIMPSVRTVIDIGGQDCKAIKLDKDGNVLKFSTNDKCAAGTGRFLEVMAKLLGISLDELGTISERAKDPLSLSSTCTVWVQAEVIHHLNSQKPIADIAAAINRAMAIRVGILANQVSPEKDICMSGGVAKNKGVVSELEKTLGVKIKKLKYDPQIVGALGAAIIAGEKAKGGNVS
ncbi:MAG: acyl-CoA dehydratase activase [Smithella sp.]|jgi:predicted CoA-substrate-specific enzyme activase